jgi:NADH-quinone oxidoreductase subunit F
MGYLLPDQPILSLDEYLATEVGGLGLARAVELGPEATITEIAASGLRGRGGAGFPTGRKWAGVREQGGSRRYAVCNGAEGEPGTFKDRMLMRTNPYQVVEGVIIAAFAVGAVESFIACKARFTRELEALTRAVEEMQAAGICRDCTLTIVRGPDEYLFGEEKALLEVIEGGPPLPRLLPPHEHGLFATAPQTGWESTEPEPGRAGRAESNPTLVNNVETLANVPHILARGADWFRSMGTAESPGHLVCTVVGDVARADVAEVELGTPLGDVIETISGTPRARIKAVCSGVANPVLTADHLGTPLSYEGFRAVGSGMGAGGFIVFAEDACMVEAARQISRFLSIESCGQCNACKRGSAEITAGLERIEAGTAGDDELGNLARWFGRVTDGNRCYLAVQEREVVSSFLRAFPEEFAEHLERGACPRPRPFLLPKLDDLVDGEVVIDLAHLRKRPDWTYGPEPESVG